MHPYLAPIEHNNSRSEDLTPCRPRWPCRPLSQPQTHERELGSIQPINSFGPNVGGGGGGGGQGSIVDKASAKDLLRADVSPMEIDSSVTFESIGGGKVSARRVGGGRDEREESQIEGGEEGRGRVPVVLKLLGWRVFFALCDRAL